MVAISTRRPAPPALTRGFTLVELGVVLAVAATLVTMATPSWLDQITRSRRAEATAELRRLQWAQERHRERNGRYAGTLAQLPGGGATSGGHYRLELRSQGPQGYELVARAQGTQSRDRDCLALTLRVVGAVTHLEPESPCWNL